MPTIFKQKVISNGIAFNDPAALPAGALAWGCDVTDGWKDTPDVTEISTELGANRDGVASANWYPVRKRYVTVGGFVKAANQADAEALNDVLVRDAFPRNLPLTFNRYESVPKTITVRRAGPILTEWTMEDGFRWQTVLMADDPLKYGITTVSGSSGVAGTSSAGLTFPVTFPVTFSSTSGAPSTSLGIINAGTAYSARFTATIVGYLQRGGWRLRNDTTGTEISFDVQVLATDSLVIDFRNEVATLNGYAVNASLNGTFWKLAPGTNIIRLYADYDATALVTVVANPAWE